MYVRRSAYVRRKLSIFLHFCCIFLALSWLKIRQKMQMYFFSSPNGDFRGIYLNVELADGVFRQYGVLPTDLFMEEEEDW